MKKLLYISVNSKHENDSCSKTVAREFINKFLENHNDFKVEEIDLYKDYVPTLRHEHFERRNSIIGSEGYENLSSDDKKAVNRINELCDQFILADVYVIASPVWSLLFPAPLKEYLDCIIQDEKTVKISEDGGGLLDDKKRYVFYIQSSGAPMNMLTKWKVNQGGNYLKDIFKFMGISEFKEVFVDSTGTTLDDKMKSISKAVEGLDKIIKNIEI